MKKILKHMIWVVILITISLSIIAFVVFFKPKNAYAEPNKTTNENDSDYTIFNLENSITNQNDYTLIVKNSDITTKCNIVYDESEHIVSLPLLAISCAMGAEVKGDITKNVEIKFDDEIYILDVVNKFLTIKGQNFNLIQSYDQSYSPSVCKQYEKDFFVESDFLTHFLYLRNYELIMDWNEKIINITEKNDESPKLIVNGKNVLSESLRINREKKYAEVPIVKICEELGAEIKWHNNIATISFEKNVYILNVNDFTLQQTGINHNLLVRPVGGMTWPYFKSCENELIVDTSTLLSFFYKIGVYAIVDVESNTVFIVKRDQKQPADSSMIDTEKP